jgi:Glucose-6-phosphate dehydrogenase subunit C-terminal domain/Glucose-6-phosphate dehydrogenase subunit N-terminal domain
MSITTLASRHHETIDVGAIEPELRAMWRAATPAARDPADQTAPPAPDHRPAVLRACRTNFVVLGNPDLPGYVEEVTLRHPARLITVGPDSRSVGGLGAHVGALCHWRTGGGLVCSERIAIGVGAGAEARVASVVRSLAVGDLAIVLHGETAAIAAYASAGLLAAVDRLILDSSGTDLATWLRIADAMPAAADAITELAWLRLRPFRTAVARAIVRTGFRKTLARLEAVDVAHAGDPTSALLLGSWIADRLRMGRPRRARPRPGVGSEGGEIDALDFPGRGRRVRFRIGPAPRGESLVLVLRTPDSELRASLAPPTPSEPGSESEPGELEARVDITSGPGRLRLMSGRKGPRAIDIRREQSVILWAATADLIVDALGHGAFCDISAPRILGRAFEMGAALGGRSSG